MPTFGARRLALRHLPTLVPGQRPAGDVGQITAQVEQALVDGLVVVTVGELAEQQEPGAAPPGSARPGRSGHRHYRGPVSGPRVPGGEVHKLPQDLRTALIANATALDAWRNITPLARNEFICWVEDAKQESTRERRVRRTQEELEEGQRRPCCWPGCKHR